MSGPIDVKPVQVSVDARIVDFQVLVIHLNELCRSNPFKVMSRYSTSAENIGSSHVAF